MAKYVGKIFKVNNTHLNIKGGGTHLIHVKKYDPSKKLFYCKIITSLEKKRSSQESMGDLRKVPHYKSRSGDLFVFSKSKYGRLRKGEITAIPVTQTKGFDYWHGYEGSAMLSKTALEGREQKGMSIKK